MARQDFSPGNGGRGGVRRAVVLLAALWLAWSAAAPAAAQSRGAVEGTAADSSGALLPGVTVELVRDTRVLASMTTDADGGFRFAALVPGSYAVRCTLPGFTTVTSPVTVETGGTSTLPMVMSVAGLSESVHVLAQGGALETGTATEVRRFTAETLTELPSASRNYTHVIVAEAGISAPLPDRTGKGMNIATTPGAQTDDSAQSLNPSVNGARPTNNGLRINGIDTTNMLAAGGSLGNNVGIPLDALEEVKVETALPSAAKGRNGGGNVELLTRSGGDRFAGTAGYYFQHEAMNANEFFLNRANVAKPEFRRNDTSVTIGGPVRRQRTFFFGAFQHQQFKSGYASNANAATGLPTMLTDVRTPETIAAVANEWLRSGVEDNPQFAQNFMNQIRAFPAEQQPGLLAQFFDDPAALRFRQLTAADIHPVAINILNQARDGQLLIPSPSSSLQTLKGNGSYGRELLLQQVIPTELQGSSSFGSVQHRWSDSHQTRGTFTRSMQKVDEAFGWADASPSPTTGKTPATLAGITHTQSFGSGMLHESTVGYFDLSNTRISKYRDKLNSTLGIYNPLEYGIGGLAALMPTIDINTQRSSGGIGNAWDFFDVQRTFTAADRWSLVAGRHLMQAGVEYRHLNFQGEFMARTNGDLDYDNWAMFFTGHGAAGGGSDLDQGDTRRDFVTQDIGGFIQDDWRVGGGLTLNLGLRYDIYGNLTERNGRMGNFYLPDVAARLGVEPGFQVPENAPFFQPDFDPLSIGILVDPGTPIDLSQIHKAKYPSTVRGDYNNVSPRAGFAWQPSFASKMVVRGGWGIYYERVGASYKKDLQLAAPFFFYQNVPAPVDMADPYPRINRNPFQIPFDLQIVRDANGSPRFVKSDGTPFPATSPFSAKSNVFIDPLLRTPYQQQWTANVQYEVSPTLLLEAGYVGSRGTGLLGKVNLAFPVDPRVTPVNGFTDIYDKLGRLINPDFFVPGQFLGLDNNGGFQQLTNIASSTYNSLQTRVRRRLGRTLTSNVAYTLARTRDILSSDGALLEHNPTRPEDNWGPASYDRTHRLTTSFMLDLPDAGAQGSLTRALTGGWGLYGLFTYQSGTPFTVYGNATRNAYFAQVGSPRVSFAPGKTVDDAIRGGRVQDRLNAYFDPTAFADSLDAWGNTGRNILRGPSQVQLDLTVARSLPFGGARRLELRWEIYNALNTPVFNSPASTFAAGGYGTAGQITSTIGGPRTMQLAARFHF